MSSLLKTGTKGKIDLPPFVLVYGQDGIGKSAMLAQAEDVIFVGPESKTEHLNVFRVQGLDKADEGKDGLNAFEKNLKVLRELRDDKHDFKNVVFESADWLERVINETICKAEGVATVNDAQGGWGKGPKLADSMTSEVISLLSEIWHKRKMGVFVTSHYQLKEFADPNTSVDYSRYSLKTRTETASLWRESVKAVLFAHYEVSKGKKDERAFSDGTRLLGTKWNASYDAKDHYGLPDIIPMGKSAGEAYANLISAIATAEPDKIKILVEQIGFLKSSLDDPERLKKLNAVQAKAEKEGDFLTLEKIVEQLKGMAKA